MAESKRLLAVSPNLPNAMHRQTWCIRDYYISKTLYNGYAAAVYTATCKYSGLDVVLKVYSDVHKAPDVAVHEMYREVAIHSGLQHPSIVHLYAAFEEGHMLVLVQEFVPGGDLLGLMAEHGGRCDESTAVKTVLQPLLGALLYLHRWGVIHRDVKPENVLFADDGSIRVIDFGLAINMIEERPISRVGTLDYMAPEVLRCPVKQNMSMAPRPGAPARYGFASDVWAIGIVTYELLTGLPPYASDCRRQAEAFICSGSLPIFPNSISPLARDFILRALAPHPGDRPTVKQMLQHPWILDPSGCAASACSRQLSPVHHSVHPSSGLASPYPYPAGYASSGQSTPQQPQPQPQPQVADYMPTRVYDNAPGLGPSPSPTATTYSSSSTATYEHACQTAATSPLIAAHGHGHAAPPAAPQMLLPPGKIVAARCTESPRPSPHASMSAAAAAAAFAPSALQPQSPLPLPLPQQHQQPRQVPGLNSELSEQLRSLQEQQILELSRLPLGQIQDMIQKLQQAMHIAATQQQPTAAHAGPGADESMCDAAEVATPTARQQPAQPHFHHTHHGHHHSVSPHHHHHHHHPAASPFASAGYLASDILHHAATASPCAFAAPSAPCTVSCASGGTDGTSSLYGSRRTTGEATAHGRPAAAAGITLPPASPMAAAAAPRTSPHQVDRSSCGGSAMHEGDGMVFVSINAGGANGGYKAGPAPVVGAGCGEQSSLEAARGVAAWLQSFVAM